MGHVDHGKTKLLDAIRSTDVVAGEFGGITQHIGAYQAHVGEREITFIDTPGHEAFTAMRARGASVTDIAVLVVAADDGVMPQTLEALDHAKAAARADRRRREQGRQGRGRPEPGADADGRARRSSPRSGAATTSSSTSRPRRTRTSTRCSTRSWSSPTCEELKGDPTGRARGTVLEAHLDKGRGPVATVLVQKGTLEVGDALIAGTAYCRIRAMQDENGRAVESAGPSKPVQILGWSHVPSAGDDFREVEDEREARHIAEEREAKTRAGRAGHGAPRDAPGPDAPGRAAPRSSTSNLIVKADVQGSVQALDGLAAQAAAGRGAREHRARAAPAASPRTTSRSRWPPTRSSSGSTSGRTRARASSPRRKASTSALYQVIYDAIDDIKAALSGLLKPEERERVLGEAEVRQTFRVPKLGVIAGSYVRGGTIRRNALARLVRDGVVVYDGKIASLRRFKDDVRRGPRGVRVRDRPGELPGPQGRRRHRGLRGRRGRPHRSDAARARRARSGSTCGSPGAARSSRSATS